MTRMLKTIAVMAALACSTVPGAQAYNGHGHTSSTPDVIDTAVKAGSFTTLVKAVQSAGLVSTLKGDGPFTVFAPTDAAFKKLPAGTVEALLLPENRHKLASILTYHVVPGKVLSKSLVGKKLSAKTVQGQSVSIEGTNGVKVDGASVTHADIITSNGVIHVIDKVILPN